MARAVRIMGRFVSNLKLLHKLAIPAVLILAASIVTFVLAMHWVWVFEDNVSGIVDRHEVLRTRFLSENGKPALEIAAGAAHGAAACF